MNLNNLCIVLLLFLGELIVGVEREKSFPGDALPKYSIASSVSNVKLHSSNTNDRTVSPFDVFANAPDNVHVSAPTDKGALYYKNYISTHFSVSTTDDYIHLPSFASFVSKHASQSQYDTHRTTSPLISPSDKSIVLSYSHKDSSKFSSSLRNAPLSSVSNSKTNPTNNLSSNPVENKSLLQRKPFCPPYDSCFRRCGKLSDSPYICNCDPECLIYSDCCADYVAACEKDLSIKNLNTSSTTALLPKTSCELLLNNTLFQMVTKCHKGYENKSINHFCKIRVSSECISSGLALKETNTSLYLHCKEFVFTNCAAIFSKKCNQTLEPMCSTLIEKHCKMFSLSKCRNCKPEFWPIIDSQGILYRNSYCLSCNFRQDKNATSLKSFHLASQNFSSSKNTLRRCYKFHVDSCSNTKSDEVLSMLCQNTLGPVFEATNTTSSKKVYKNIYCAKCNGKALNELICASLSSTNFSEIIHSTPVEIFDISVTGKIVGIQGLKINDIPTAFSMLLNFGLDGRQRVYIASEGDDSMKKHQLLCGAGKIWDPFSHICRKLHCSTAFVLVNYQCVRKDPAGDIDSQENGNISVPDASSDFVHLSFSVEMELIDFLGFYQQDIEEMCENIRESFANSFSINIHRIKNVKFDISLNNSTNRKEALEILINTDEDIPVNFTISLDLYETPSNSMTPEEPSVDTVVSMMASALSMNAFEFGINKTIGRIYEMHQSVDFLSSWCREKDGGITKQYWNSEFKLILNDDPFVNASDKIEGIYINQTGKFYTKGEFIADILYQGYQFNQNLINVSGVAIVCDYKPKLNESCIRILLEINEYYISENGSLFVQNSSLSNSVIDSSTYEQAENGSVLVCLLNGPFDFKTSYRLHMDYYQRYISFLLLCISVTAMVLVLFTYCCFSSLRNLPGCNTMNLTLSLTLMQITYIFSQRSTVVGKTCQVVAAVLHYEILCCFMWMNVIAYDLYKTFGSGKNILNNLRSKGKFLSRYMIYAYGFPMLIIATSSLTDFLQEDCTFAPQYGRSNLCWITNRNAAIVFFAVPLAVVMSVNFVLYVLTIFSIKNVKKDIYLSHERINHRSDVFLYARMALVIGLTWALAFAAAFVSSEKLLGKILTYLFIIFNTLQGVFIFCVFICNRKVFELYQKSVGKILYTMSSKTTSSKKKKNLFSKFSGIVHRSDSRDTVVSTISNSSNCSNDSNITIIEEE